MSLSNVTIGGQEETEANPRSVEWDPMLQLTKEQRTLPITLTLCYNADGFRCPSGEPA